MTVSVNIGAGPTGAPITIDLEELLATRLLVQGNSGSGKSHLLRRLLERSASEVQQIVIDPEGDFVTLSERYGHVAVEALDEGRRGERVWNREPAELAAELAGIEPAAEAVEVYAAARRAPVGRGARVRVAERIERRNMKNPRRVSDCCTHRRTRMTRAWPAGIFRRETMDRPCARAL